MKRKKNDMVIVMLKKQFINRQQIYEVVSDLNVFRILDELE